MKNPLVEVAKFGQSIWYDNIRRGLLTSGELKKLIEEDGITGVTSNPAIFEKALNGSTDYDSALPALVQQGAQDANEIYERLAIEDIRMAADILRPVHARTAGVDGYVSFEVSPYLARDAQGTIEEARRLHAAIGKDNVMIKIPATPECVPAVQTVIGDGINVNVTLLFSVEAYEAVANAYMAGLEALAAKGGDLSRVRSVASFFISRIDSLVDEKIARELDQTRDSDRREKLKSLMGKIAIANAKLAYARYQELYATERWKALAAKGAKPQRLLWASTSTKNPKYPKTVYVDELIAPDTVNTAPHETVVEYRQNGKPRAAFMTNWAENLEQARRTMKRLEEVGISMKEVTEALLADAIKKFSDPFDKLLSAVEKKRQATLGGDLARATQELGSHAAAVQATLEDWRASAKVRRLWDADASLWSNTDEDRWLGWMHVVAEQAENDETFKRIAEDARGFAQVMVLGMGGSSLCPDVLRATFGRIPGHPELLVLDSTVPAQVRAFESKVDLKNTLFIVSSKSGTTTEPNVFRDYFLEKVRQAVGAADAGSRFIAITDPNTEMYKVAKKERFRAIYHGVPSIGGRYSALSNFGMVPAAAMGLDVPAFLDRTALMVHACASCAPPDANPGVTLGAILGTLGKAGRDKVTLVASPAIDTLGAWLEQLLAESLGKEGKGLIPIASEPVGAPSVYGQDRLFVYVRLASAPSAEQDAAIAALEKAGQPVVRIALDEAMDLGQEFFRWEIATAVAGAVLGINAFNQPDVEAAKVATRKLTNAYEESGKLPPETALLEGDGFRLFADPANGDALAAAAGGQKSVEGWLRAHLGRIRTGDYFAVNAYVEMNDRNDRELQALRVAVRDARKVATTVGYGPRFLHSTGQLHKGGPNTGVFLQVTCDDPEVVPIPGRKYDFGILKQAQAAGDFQVLAERGRRLLRVHLGKDVAQGLEALRKLVQRVVA